MNNDIYNRLAALFSELGLNTDAEFTKAELCAYAQGLSIVKEQLEEEQKYIFAKYNTESKYFSKFRELLGADGADYNTLKFLLSSSNGILSSSDFRKIMLLFSMAGYTTQGNKIVFSNVPPERVKKLMQFLRNWLPLGCFVEFDGNSLIWDYWDMYFAEIDWNTFDGWQAPFNLLEHIV